MALPHMNIGRLLPSEDSLFQDIMGAAFYGNHWSNFEPGIYSCVLSMNTHGFSLEVIAGKSAKVVILSHPNFDKSIKDDRFPYDNGVLFGYSEIFDVPYHPDVDFEASFHRFATKRVLLKRKKSLDQVLLENAKLQQVLLKAQVAEIKLLGLARRDAAFAARIEQLKADGILNATTKPDGVSTWKSSTHPIAPAVPSAALQVQLLDALENGSSTGRSAPRPDDPCTGCSAANCDENPAECGVQL